MKRCALVLFAALALAACHEGPTQADSDRSSPLFEIKDAVHNGGLEHFFFLPPMVSDPVITGAFDGSLEPVVEICAGTSTNSSTGTCQNPLTEFSTTTGPGSETVRVVPTKEHYIANWHTDEFNLNVDETYRIRVLAGGTELGHADVDVVSGGNALHNVDTGEFIPLKDGRTLPIKFRIEEGLDFVAASVEVTPTAATLDLGETIQLTATPKNAAGDPLNRAVNWSSSNNAVATVDASGRVTPIGAGSTVISASTGGISGSALITVDAVASVNVTPSTVVLDPHKSVQLTATPRNSAGDVLNRPIDWSSSDDLVATVDANGLVTGAVAVGSTTISARSGTETGTAVVTVLSPVVVTSQRISAGSFHACTIRDLGQLYCWGRNSEGQLGAGSNELCTINQTACSTTPVLVSGGLSFESVAASIAETTCGVTTDGDAYCWGRAIAGQLGDGTTPVMVTGGLKFRSVTVSDHVCGITTSDDAYCWGRNIKGQLGNGTETNSSIPVLVSGGLKFQSLSAGGFTTCGVTTDGDAYCWGANDVGQLGNGTWSTVGTTTPRLVSGGLTFVTVSTGGQGGQISCGLTELGDAYCWGARQSRSIICSFGRPCSPVPLLLTALAITPQELTFQSITVKGTDFCGITVDGEAYCKFPRSIFNSLTLVPGGHIFASMTTGATANCGITTNDETYCWGENDWGQVGDGTTVERLTPVLVSQLQ